MIFHSIRWRLQAWYGVVFLLVLGGFGVTAYQLESNRQMRNVDGELQRHMGALANQRPPPFRQERFNGPMRARGGPPGEDFPEGGPRGGPPFPGSPEEGGPPPQGFRSPQNLAGFFGSESNSFYFVVWSQDGSIVTNSPAAPLDIPMPVVATRRGPGPPVPPGPPRMRGVYREVIHGTPNGEIILVGRSIAEEMAGLRLVAWSLAGAGAFVLLLGLAGGWWVASRAIRPIQDISATAAKIAAGDLSHRISAAETDSELGRLAAVLNSTFARLDAAFAHQRQFTSDAAHELRTPLSVMLTQTQTVLNRERSPVEYREAVEACQRAAQRMRGLMESLLQLARLDAGQETMKHLAFDLAEVAKDGVEQIAPLAAERRIRIQCEIPPMPCVGDAGRISQVVMNLLGNAIEYNQENGEVHLKGVVQGEQVVLAISNTGPGIAAEDLPRIFERFYRADKSRTGGGHSGLGLSISKAIVDAHGGSLEAASEVGKTVELTLRLPAAGTSEAGTLDSHPNH